MLTCRVSDTCFKNHSLCVVWAMRMNLHTCIRCDECGILPRLPFLGGPNLDFSRGYVGAITVGLTFAGDFIG